MKKKAKKKVWLTSKSYTYNEVDKFGATKVYVMPGYGLPINPNLPAKGE